MDQIRCDAGIYRPLSKPLLLIADILKNRYNLLYREEEREMIKYCNATGVAVIPVSCNMQFRCRILMSRF